MLNTVDGPSEQVEDYLCDPEKMPLGARNSRLPCPEDCVLSDWGGWSPCPLVGATLASSPCRLLLQTPSLIFGLVLYWSAVKKAAFRMSSAVGSPPQPCHVNSTRRRSAYPLRQPGAEKMCPPTEGTEPCTLNTNCFHYSYNITGKHQESSTVGACRTTLSWLGLTLTLSCS